MQERNDIQTRVVIYNRVSNQSEQHFNIAIHIEKCRTTRLYDCKGNHRSSKGKYASAAWYMLNISACT